MLDTKIATDMIYTDFSVENYRGIRRCRLEKLEQVNLFFGKNNCGKSSLLESLFILSGPDNPTLPILANKSRALDSLEETDLKIEFYQANPEHTIQLSSLGEQSRQVSIRMIESHSQDITLEDLQKTSSESAGKRYGLKTSFSTETEKAADIFLLRSNFSNKGIGSLPSIRGGTDVLLKESCRLP